MTLFGTEYGEFMPEGVVENNGHFGGEQLKQIK